LYEAGLHAGFSFCASLAALVADEFGGCLIVLKPFL
jgi:hypothetical protein